MRTKLPDRRQSETRKMTVTYATGTSQTILITVGFDDDGVAKEVFCADFKAGSDIHAMVMDACVLVSRILQYGDDVAELSSAMCQGPSIIGAILAEIASCRAPAIRYRNGNEGDDFASFRANPPSSSGGAAEALATA